jgi:hypothetical protein
MRRATAATVAIGLMLEACGATSSPAPGADASARPAHPDTGPSAMPTTTAVPPSIAHTYAPTYTAIWEEILSPTCGTEFCHGGAALYLDLESKALGYSTLVNFPAEGPECKATGLLHVKPGDPGHSLLYLKVTAPPCGKAMPILYTTSGTLDPRELEQIRRWIELGAPLGEGGDASADAPSDAR